MDRVSSQKPFGLDTIFHGQDRQRPVKYPVYAVRVAEGQAGSTRQRSRERSLDRRMEGAYDAASRDRARQIETEVSRAGRSLPSQAPHAPRPTSCWAFRHRSRGEKSRGLPRTRFVRFLVSLCARSPSTHTRNVYTFVPDLPLDQEWTDEKLYERYGLTADEIAFIESQVAEHDDPRPTESRGCR